MSNVSHWNRQYRAGRLPWDTGQPSTELRCALAEIKPCRAIEFGCGRGTNAVWLARQGFDVTAVDLSRRAIRGARQRAAAAGVHPRFLVADLADSWKLGGPFAFFFDRGCYHAVRRDNLTGYLHTLEQVCPPGALGLVLAGNAGEPEDDVGPPVVEADELRREFGEICDVLRLRAFRFDAAAGEKRYLGWSCLLRRR